MRIHYEWACPLCSSVLQSRRKLLDHKRTVHTQAVHYGNQKTQVYSRGGLCKYCGKTCSKFFTLRRHELHCKLNPDGIPLKGHQVSEETKQKIRNTSKLTHTLGGVRHGSGRGKKGWYCGYFCDSSWELAFVLFNIDHGITFQRNTQSFDYLFNDKMHKYFPDFLVSGVYYEIKGYKTKQWKAKVDQFPDTEQLVVLDKNGIQPYLAYATETYGKDFVRLYEK